MTERWVPIENYEGLYEVSDYGKVRSLDHIVQERGGRWDKSRTLRIKGRLLKPGKCGGSIKGEYLFVQLCKNGIATPHYIHRLVAKAFVPNPKNKPEVDHKDRNKINNHYKNLKWTNSQGNKVKKLKNKDVGIVAARHRNGETYKEISKDYGVHEATLSVRVRKRGL